MSLDESVLLAARIVVGGAFLIIGIRNVANHKMIGEMLKANKFPAAELLALTGIGMQIAFGALMIVGLFPVVAALGLLVFTVTATLMAHSFWTFRDKTERAAQINVFLANMIVVGGLLALVAAAL
ncbi:MAG: DoxX family protein [Hyphomonadaceae bacterium]|nr:DoxX family protein [Hyphomonadaceae bacterium]